MDDEEMQGMSFGHAGTIVEGKEDSATEKIARLEAAGIPVVERIDEIPATRQGGASGWLRDSSGTASSSTSRSTSSVAARRRAGEEARGGLPGRHLHGDAGGGSRSVRENLDECVLCELCLDAAPDGAVTVRKLYDGTELER